MATKRLHGLEALAFVEEHGGQLYGYDWHEQGAPAGLEESPLSIEEARTVVSMRPWLIYVDVEDNKDENNKDTAASANAV